MLDLSPKYLAGLIDGEGSFTIQLGVRLYKGKESLRFNPRLCIGMKGDILERELLKDIGEAYSLGVYVSNEGEENCTIRCMGTNVEANIILTKTVLPYLVLKKEKAELFLEVCELIKLGRDSRYRTGSSLRGDRTYTKEQMIRVVEIATRMNKGRQSTRFRDSQSRNTDYYLQKIDKMYKV